LAIDGIFDAIESVTNILSEKLRGLLEDRHMDAFNAATREAIGHDRVLRWYIDQGLWSFGVSTPYEFFDRVLLYIHWRASPTVSHGPVLICQAADDLSLQP
jgi:hypothetical protein